jgi:glycosyltransferase involved in cell wall biosynthesis
MPAYNVAGFVTRAVQSILEQTHGDFEFIIIDDGSTDSTLEIVSRLARKDARISLISQANAGVSAASNRAVEMARGTLIARIDADDIAHPQRLEKQLRYMRQNRDCVGLGSGMMLIDEAGLPLYPMASIAYGHREIDAALMAGGWPIAQPACMYRRETVLAVGGYRADLSLHEDHDLFLRLAERGRLENLPEILQFYRQRSTSLMGRASAQSHAVVMPEIVRQACLRRGVAMVERMPEKNPESETERHHKWGWRSLKAGHVQTARKYARATLRREPFSPRSWKLMYCALRGY